MSEKDIPAPVVAAVAAAATDDFTIKLEDLGPIIVNTDGTLQRIPNWSEMPKEEQAKTVRLVSARNKKRLQALAAEMKTEMKGATKINGNMMDNIAGEENSDADPMKGSGKGKGVTKSVVLTIEHS
jgi:uncharacterized protein (DUF2342 family)